MDEYDRLLPWFSLKSAPGVGNLLFKRLIESMGSPEAILGAPVETLSALDGISARLAKAIARHKIPDDARKDLHAALERGYTLTTYNDPDYPSLLRQIADPPPYLYVSGTLSSADACVAIVGSRNPTEYGLSAARRLGRDLAERGFTVVSGMAVGVDTAAHQGALDGAGRTVAVLGSGLDRIYPAENRRLYGRISEQGAVISEFSPKTDPESHNFPIRNRIISGMSLGTLVAEATLRSGSLITARLAAEQGRDVFAVPGSISSFKSTGTHTLIKQGAKLVEHAGDIVEELSPLLEFEPEPAAGDPPCQPPLLTEEESAVFSGLGPYPVHIDDLVRRLSMDPGKLSGILLSLELKGVIQQLPGKYFALREK